MKIFSQSKPILAVVLSVMLLSMGLGHLAMGGSQHEEKNTVIEEKTLTRVDPVVMLGSQFPNYVTAQLNVSNLFVWAFRDGGWQQVVFQIDEVNGYFERKGGGVAGPHKNYYIADDGLLDADDEIVFMGNETGDRVNVPIWPPDANTSVPRYEITVVDPLDTSKKGWAYLFYHDTPPGWTTVDYGSWNEAGNDLTMYGYSLNYNDAEDRMLYYTEMNIHSNIGGDGVDIVDRDKRAVGFGSNQRCEGGNSNRGLETYYSGLDDDQYYYHDYHVKDGPVRVLRHLRWGFGSTNLFDSSDKMGWRASNEYKYYPSMYTESEYIANTGSNDPKIEYYYRAVDHAESAGAMNYYNSESCTGTINGNSADDSVSTTLQTWDQVSSSHGSYVSTYDVNPWSNEADCPCIQTTRWLDDMADPDTDSDRTGAEGGRFGEHGIYMVRGEPTVEPRWGSSRSYYNVYFLPADMPNVGDEYYDYSENPLITTNPSPANQTYVSDHYPPETASESVKINGGSYYGVPISSAGTVELTATVSDANTGNSNVVSSVWTNGYANFPGTEMTAADGAFDSPTENVLADIDLSGWNTGTYEIHVYGTDEHLNLNETSMEHAIITITDDMPPATDPGTVLVDGENSYETLFSEATPVLLEAIVNDTGRGGSSIISVEWTNGFANLPGTPMSPADGAFDEQREPVEEVLTLDTWNAGIYDLYVYGTDAIPLQNTTSSEHATVTIIDDVAPSVEDVFLNGMQNYSIYVSQSGILNLTATVNDVGRGGSVIGGCNFTKGAMNWASSTSMSPDTVLNTPDESFTTQVDVSGWSPGTYFFYAYGWDSAGNGDVSSTAHATLTIQNNMAPEVKNVLVNDATEVSIPFSQRNVVTLNATLDDTGHGDNIISNANYTMGMANWPTSKHMTPVDELDSPIENFTATVDISEWGVGTYDLYPYGWDIAKDFNATSTLFARVIIHDDVEPAMENVLVEGESVYETTNVAAGEVTLTAWVNDTLTGDTVAGGANWTLEEKNWGSGGTLSPTSALDSSLEQFSTTIDISSWSSGIYQLYAYGWDAVPNHNTTSTAFATLVIHDILAPAISNVRINGSTIFTIDYANATTIELTGLLDDTNRGDSEIGGANWTRGHAAWNSSQPLYTYNDEATADMPVTGNVSSDDYSAPDHHLNTAQNPDDGRCEYIEEGLGTDLKTYDFSTYGTGDKQGFVRNSNNGNFDASDWNMGSGGTITDELAAGDYADISTQDGAGFRYDNTAAKYWRYHIHIDEVETDITQIDAYWHSNDVERPACGPISLHIWDDANAAWVQLDSDSTSSNNQALSLGGTIDANVQNYVDASGYVYLGIFSEDTGEWFSARYVETDYVNVTIHHNQMLLEHRWQFDMGSNPTFYVDASNPASSDSDFQLQWSSDGGASWNGFTSDITYHPGELDVLKSSTIPLGSYADDFLVRVVSVNPGPGADTFSVDRMWAEGQFNNNPEPVWGIIDISTWQPGTYQLYVYGWDKSPQYNLTSQAYATLVIGDDIPPELYDFLVDGVKNLTVNLSDGNVTFTGVVDDRQTGNSVIQWGGFQNANETYQIGMKMEPDDVLDSPLENFSLNIDISGWRAGENLVLMAGCDMLENVNSSETENLSLTINDDVEPYVEEFSALINGTSAYRVNVDEATNVTLEAIIGDDGRGYSNIAGANWTLGPENWPGNPMSPQDGSFDNYTEKAVSTINISDWPEGSYVIYVYGTDAWGNGNVTSMVRASLDIDGKGPAISNVRANDDDTAKSGENPYELASDQTSFFLLADGDDRDSGYSNIVGAEYFVDEIGENGTGISMKNAGFRWDSPVESAKATIDCSDWTVGEHHIYYVHFLDASGYWGDLGSVVVSKNTFVNVSYHEGWNFISVPLYIDANPQISQIFAEEWNNIEAIQYYNAETKLWELYHRDSPSWLNSLTHGDTRFGYWVKFSSSGDGNLTVEGALYNGTGLTLKKGWNMVGYASFNNQTVSEALAGVNYDMMMCYDVGAPYLIRDMADGELMSYGNAYWIHVTSDTIWNLP